MLIQFNFKNCKSFRDEATLDLSAAKMTEFSERVVSVGSEKILPVAAVYGANASGKSYVYGAFEYHYQNFSTNQNGTRYGFRFVIHHTYSFQDISQSPRSTADARNSIPECNRSRCRAEIQVLP